MSSTFIVFGSDVHHLIDCLLTVQHLHFFSTPSLNTLFFTLFVPDKASDNLHPTYELGTQMNLFTSPYPPPPVSLHPCLVSVPFQLDAKSNSCLVLGYGK